MQSDEEAQKIVDEIMMCFAPLGDTHKAERLLGFSCRQRSLLTAFKRLGCTEADFLLSQYQALAALGYDFELETGSSSGSKASDGEGSPTLLKKVTRSIQALLKQSQLPLPPQQRQRSLSPVHAAAKPVLACAPVLPQRRHTVCAPSFLLDRPKAAGLVATAVPADLFVQGASICSKHCCDTFEPPPEFFPTRQEALEEENAQLKAMLRAMGVDAAAAATACCTPSYYAGGTAANMWSTSVASSERTTPTHNSSSSKGGIARGRFPERATSLNSISMLMT
jgi:hypothetical protein